jgi:hypothetical protein
MVLFFLDQNFDFFLKFYYFLDIHHEYYFSHL